MESNTELMSAGKNVILFSCCGARGLLAGSELLTSCKEVHSGKRKLREKNIFPQKPAKEIKGCSRQYYPGLQRKEWILGVQSSEEFPSLIMWKDTRGQQEIV